MIILSEVTEEIRISMDEMRIETKEINLNVNRVAVLSRDKKKGAGTLSQEISRFKV